MKKLFILAMCLFALVAFTGCKGQKTDFKFKAEVTGVVADSATHIDANFTAFVTNDLGAEWAVANKKTLSIESSEGEKANAWLDNYVQETYLSQLNSATTIYEITIKGYVKESLTGIVFYVDKTFTNKK